MDCLYKNLLSPEFYSCPKAAKFIDAIISPEIDNASEKPSSDFCSSMPGLDTVLDQLESIATEMVDTVKKRGVVPCQFIAFVNQHPIVLQHPTPVSREEISELLSVGKCLAFCTCAHSIFFVSEVYHDNGMPIIGQDIPVDAKWGIQIVGSSASGNALHSIIQMDELYGKLVNNKPQTRITRDRQFHFPFAKFYNIANEDEMSKILSQINTLTAQRPMPERDVIINFAVILKSLLKLGYNK